MGRPSKLTDSQWERIEKRLLAGESASSLGREFEVSKATISTRFSERLKNVKSVAHQVIEADRAFSLLNVSEQIATRSLIDDWKAISLHLAGAAKFGASTAHRLAGIANGKVSQIDDSSPLDDESLESLKGIAVLTKMANAAAEIPLNLLNANKDAVKEANKPPEPEAIATNVRPQLTKDEWLEAHGLGATARAAE